MSRADLPTGPVCCLASAGSSVPSSPGRRWSLGVSACWAVAVLKAAWGSAVDSSVLTFLNRDAPETAGGPPRWGPECIGSDVLRVTLELRLAQELQAGTAWWAKRLVASKALIDTSFALSGQESGWGNRPGGAETGPRPHQRALELGTDFLTPPQARV